LEGHTETVELLLDEGAGIDKTERKNGMPALILAAVQGHAETIGKLLEKGAAIDSRDNTAAAP
jgi:ankyrin repeat protein